MVICYDNTFKENLESIGFNGNNALHQVTKFNSPIFGMNDRQAEQLLESTGNLQKGLLSLLNTKFKDQLGENKLLKRDFPSNEEPYELSMFFNEALANIMNRYNEVFLDEIEVFIGENGYIVGIKQKGGSFDAKEVDSLRKKTNFGRGFNRYRGFNNTVFFDKPKDTSEVYFMQKFAPEQKDVIHNSEVPEIAWV